MAVKRNISVDIEQARDWYNSGNEALREIALQAFDEDELTMDYSYIEKVPLTVRIDIPVPLDELKRWETLHKLANIAYFLNNGWKISSGKAGYFINFYPNINGGKDPCVQLATAEEALPGVIYFKNSDDAVRAINILGPDINYLK